MNEGEQFKQPDQNRVIIKPEDLLDAQREVPAENQKLIAEREKDSVYLSQDFAQYWREETLDEIYRKSRDFLRQHLEDGVLIDLGGGSWGSAELARYLGAATYINVERNLRSDEEIPPNPLAAIKDEQTDDLQEILIKADMLDFVSRLRDNSANFMINGIDESAINDFAYHLALAKELERATKPGGVVFGINSEISGVWSERGSTMKGRWFKWSPPDSFFFEKPKNK